MEANESLAMYAKGCGGDGARQKLGGASDGTHNRTRTHTTPGPTRRNVSNAVGRKTQVRGKLEETRAECETLRPERRKEALGLYRTEDS